MALLAISEVRETGLEHLGTCLWPHRLWQQSVDALTGLSGLVAYQARGV